MPRASPPGLGVGCGRTSSQKLRGHPWEALQVGLHLRSVSAHVRKHRHTTTHDDAVAHEHGAASQHRHLFTREGW